MSGIKAISALPLALAVMLVAAPAAGQAQDQSQNQALRLTIIVDTSCLIQPESDPSILGDHYDAFRDSAICHLAAVFNTHHIEEKIADGERSRFLVRVAEQEYILQNPTDRPAVFIVRHNVPENWTLDSDPQPSSMDGATAVFQLNAEPGQRVRLHVGMRRSFNISSDSGY
jgi:hypothetical protein